MDDVTDHAVWAERHAVHDRHTEVWTPELRLALGAYVRRLADRMGLRGWRFELDYDPQDADGVTAESDLLEGRAVSVIRFSERFLEGDDDERRESVVHELLHCHHAEATYMVEADLRDALGTTAHDLFTAAWRRSMERCVDRLAALVAPTMPPCRLPDRHTPR